MKKFYLFFLIFYCFYCHAQWELPQFQIGASAYSSIGKQAPFWFINDRNGQFQNEKNNLLTSLAFHNKPLPADSSKFLVEYGLEMDFAVNNTDQYVWLQKGYLKARIYAVELMVGRYYQYLGNGDSTLSSGYLLYSNNAKPIPKVGLGSRGWIDVPYSRGYVQFKGLIEHGWFEQDRYVKNVWLHHKNFYVRVGGDFPVNLSGGLNHYAQWAGTSTDPEYGEFPSDFDTFIEVLLARNADSSDTSLPDNERLNRIGNHLGSWNFGLEVETKPLNIACYYQSIFEDNSGYKRKFNRDGLWGLSLHLNRYKPVDKIVLEFVKTTYQSGDVHIKFEKFGNDNYFNNSLYRNGWSYYNHTIGNPFITSPFYFGDENIRFSNNRVLVYYFGFSGELGTISYEWRSAFSQNKGTHSQNFDPVRKQFSTLLKLKYLLGKKHHLELNCAMDSGEMYGDNIGLGLSYLYQFSFKK